MTLPASGQISISQVSVELGRASNATTSLGESEVRTLAGVPSGAISMSNLWGKSNVAFTPDGGTTAGSPIALEDVNIGSASITIYCTTSAVWTWTRSGSTAGQASVVSGNSAFEITFSIVSSGLQTRGSVFTVSGTAGGITRYYTVTIIAEGNA